MKPLKYLILLILIASPFWAPTTHEAYMRNYIDSKTVRLVGAAGSGTGFLVKAPSGKDYILTNRHVCEIGQLWLDAPRTEEKRQVKLTQLEISEKTDLCVLAAPAYMSDGLDLASEEPEYGDGIAITGHPSGSETPVLTRGKFLQKAKVWHPWEAINNLEEYEACEAKKDRIAIITFFGGWCLKEIDSYLTTTLIYPGNSGSAAVNFWGNVVGVAWGADTRTNRAVLATLPDIKEFLEIY